VRGREHHAAHVCVLFCALQSLNQLVQELGRQGVAGIRLVEGDGGDSRVRHVVKDRLVGQAFSSEVGSSTPSFDGSPVSRVSADNTGWEKPEMRRLRDGQAVSLEVEALETNLECLVIAIEGNEATLDPIYKAFSMSVPTTGAN